ncbi:MAG: glycosyltransferase, partial [Coriobacteriaceae bacterium]|nr:glycosyltransferase [Coriobacteriaceae bacterium]
MFTAVLFHRFPKVSSINDNQSDYPSVSVIIPVRNEETTLPRLLNDLKAQSITAIEIICVDDASEDATANIVSAYDVQLISLDDKPAGWLGKSWA